MAQLSCPCNMAIYKGFNDVYVNILLITFLCVPMHCITSNVDYFTSQHGLQKLASAEQEIAGAVANYITTLERRLEAAKRYMSDYASSGVGLNSSTIALDQDEQDLTSLDRQQGVTQLKNPSEMAAFVSAHPLRAYRLLRRYVTDLPTLEKEMRSDDERKFLKLTEKLKSKISFPTKQDINGASEGILRAHDTYNMNIDDFASGKFYGLSTNTSMNAGDCFSIGIYSLQANILTRAIEWLERAYKLVTRRKDSTIAKKDVKEKLHQAITMHNEELAKGSKNPYLFLEPVKLQNSLNGIAAQRKRVLDTNQYVLKNKQPSFMDLTNFAALCRGKQLRSHKEMRRLNCWLERKQPLTMLNPLKVERHSFHPPVLQLYDLVSDRIVDKIIQLATTSLSRAQVHVKTQPNNKMISSSRTSTATWIYDGNSSPIKEITKVYRRLEQFTGLKILDKGASEDLQVSCYGIAGHFNPHLDTIFNAVDKKQLDKEEIKQGDRFATIMFYLSDVARGGTTAFSRIGVTTEAVKGSAVFWYNMNSDGVPDPLTLHGGCPILYGNKCVSNKWIRFNSQSNSRQCSVQKALRA